MTNEERLAALLKGWFALLAANDKAAWNTQVQAFHKLGPDATRFLLQGIAMKQEQLQGMTAERDALQAKWDAVPVAALEFCVDAASYTYDCSVGVAQEWLKQVQS